MLKQLLLCALGAAMITQAAMSAVIPVSEDTYSTANGTIIREAGKAGGLLVSGTGTSLIRFDVGGFSGLINPAAVIRARAVVYVKSVQKAGDLKVHAVTAEWTEAATGNIAAPAYDAAVLATVPAETLRGGQYVIIDVTAQVKAWLTTPASDFGLALEGSTIRNLQLSAKEGALSGHAAWLEIETGAVVTPDQLAAGIDASKLGDGSVSNQEFAYLHGVLSPLQEQLTTINTSLATVTADSAEKVNKAGDTMTGSLTVKGDVKVGNSGELYAASGEENLRIVRGVMTTVTKGGDLSILEGKGYTVRMTGAEDTCVITFDKPFSGVPTVTANVGWVVGGKITAGYIDGMNIESATATSVTLNWNVDLPNLMLHFIVVGPR